MPLLILFTGAPITRTSPPLAGSSPEINASVVDLPHPVGPTTDMNWPFLTSSSSIAGARSDPGRCAGGEEGVVDVVVSIREAGGILRRVHHNVTVVAVCFVSAVDPFLFILS